MKKTYNIPAIRVVKLQKPQLLSGSLQYNRTTDATSGNLAREFGGFDDDEE